MNKNIENRMRAYLKISGRLEDYINLLDYFNSENKKLMSELTIKKIGFLQNAKKKIANALIFLLKEENNG